MKLLVSACLLGERVRYDGQAKEIDGIKKLAKTHELISFCPEVSGGLPVPRQASELKGSAINILKGNEGGVFTKEGANFTKAFLQGAEKALALCKQHDIKIAILKERSPSCGANFVYDGTHQGRVIPGEGITAALLKQHGIQVFTEDNFMALETL
ncbi:MAG: DUF523 domain-containing protein [Clostridium sp.]|nr:DUF523 domain-containing protein [Clostridium sp.]